MLPGTLDPLGAARFSLEGRIVTMNAAFDVLPRGTLYRDCSRLAT
jgi:hypothetical protein